MSPNFKYSYRLYSPSRVRVISDHQVLFKMISWYKFKFNSRAGGDELCCYLVIRLENTITSITAVLFPFVTYLLTLPRMSPSDRVVQLHPQVPDCLFIAFYDSQGYSGGIVPRLHTRPEKQCARNSTSAHPVRLRDVMHRLKENLTFEIYP
jgi:hypothetical protein